MTDSFTVEIQGKAEFEATLRNLVKALPDDKVEPIMLDGAKVIAADARRRAPVGPTGNLKKSIITKLLRKIGDYPRTAMAAVNQRKAPHAHLVEFGHVNWRGGIRKRGKGHLIGGKKGTRIYTPAHPFWRPAVDTNWKRVENNIIEKLWALIMAGERK